MLTYQTVSYRRITAKTIFSILISVLLALDPAFGQAESRFSLDNTRINRTRSSIFKLKPGDKAPALPGYDHKLVQKIVSRSKDRSQLLVLSTNKPREFKGFFSNPDSFGERSRLGRRFNHYTHKFNMMQLASTQGVIDNSLDEAAKKARLSDDLIDQLTQIFAWDIDFAQDLRKGDRFIVVYEKGGYNGSDDIVAAEFTNRGKTHRAVRYIDNDGFANYYTPDGHPLQKAFLSTPVDFARISSHFNLSRRHPVLNRIRAHKGVDYAARTGTPVKATGHGQINFLGRKGGYGNVIIVQHGDRYETVYAHLSRYKLGLQEGDTVKQGEVIGYVGQTGLATGPHLHYEFRIDGVHQNPLTVQAANALPVRSSAMAEFKSQTQDSVAKLNLAKAKSLFARNNQVLN